MASFSLQKRKDIMDSGTTGLRKTDDVLLNKKNPNQKTGIFKNLK